MSHVTFPRKYTDLKTVVEMFEARLSPTEAADICERAADVLEEYGWTQSLAINPRDGSVCVNGSIAVACGAKRLRLYPGLVGQAWQLVEDDAVKTMECIRYFSAHLGVSSALANDSLPASDEGWTMVRELRSCAKALREIAA